MSNSYGPRAYSNTRHDRRQVLLDTYYFECECTACIDEHGDYAEKEIAAEEMLTIEKGEVEEAKKFAKCVENGDMTTGDVMRGLGHAATVYGKQNRKLQTIHDCAVKILIKVS